MLRIYLLVDIYHIHVDTCDSRARERILARPFPAPDYAFLQAERDDSLVAQAPHLPLRIPTPAGLPDLLLQRALISANAIAINVSGVGCGSQAASSTISSTVL